MELFLIGPFKPFISQSVLRTEKMRISHRLRDEGFERKKFLRFLNVKIWVENNGFPITRE
jgi:hypothetical protein